jgi:hypothetical protein
VSPVARSVLAQYSSVVAGYGYHWAARHGYVPHPHYLLAAAAGVGLLLFEALSRRGRAIRLANPTALALAVYSMWLMWTEAFLWIGTDSTLVRPLLLLLPYLWAITRLARSGTCFGIVGASLFLATSIAMFSENASASNHACGFLDDWIS